MIELEESFSANDRYLVEEHLRHGTDDFLLTGIGEATFVVPYKYRAAGTDEVHAIQLFKRDLLDFQRKEAARYQEAGQAVRRENYNGEWYVVPFELRDKKISAARLAKYVEQAALKKYNLIIESYRDLSARGYELPLMSFSMAAANKYLSMLERTTQVKEQSPAAPTRPAKSAGKAGKREGMSGLARAKQTIKHHCKAVSVSALIGISVLGGLLNRGCQDKEHAGAEGTKIEAYHYAGHDGTYIDFSGTAYSDSLGNIERIMELKPEISAMLIAVEGYAGNAYKDGVGQTTIGSGTTFYLVDSGQEVPVQMGEEITPDRAMEQKWRFIEKKMLKHMGDKMGRKCSDGELMACIGAGFCWGERAFSKSAFYKSVQNGESAPQQARKLTGFRQQKGLLKREYVLAACLLGKWNAKDLLDVPIYLIPGKGFLNCAPYRLELREIMPCQQDKKGHYKKDKLGNDVPIVEKDDFCTFYDNFKTVYHEMLKKASHSYEDVRYVRDFMPENMTLAINEKSSTNNLLFINNISTQNSH